MYILCVFIGYATKYLYVSVFNLPTLGTSTTPLRRQALPLGLF
jgi:hypothetical protein